MVRLFIAINPEPEVGINLESALSSLRGIFSDSRWVPSELMHLTVKFLGERDEAFAGAIAARLDALAGIYRPIPYTISGLGAFPNLRRPAVVWVGVHADTKLELMSHDVESACEHLGVPVDGRPFRPHITVARVRRSSPQAAQAFAGAVQNFTFEARSTARSLDLMLSEQRGGKLSYRKLHGALLR
jgi:2'-5' RNA ligase